jgi:hypothetical protein
MPTLTLHERLLNFLKRSKIETSFNNLLLFLTSDLVRNVKKYKNLFQSYLKKLFYPESELHRNMAPAPPYKAIPYGSGPSTLRHRIIYRR